MRINRFFLLAGLLAFLFSACGEENPAVFPIETSSNDISLSSSFSTQYSSSINDIESSSSIVVSSSIETSSSSWEPYSYGELIDERDGQTYKTIKIGEQLWMAENLNYAYLQPTSTGDSASECYNNEPDSCAKYGRLYLWSAAMDSAAIFSKDGKDCGDWKYQNVYENPSCNTQPHKGVQGVCPESWHIPTKTDINTFSQYANASTENFNSIVKYWLSGNNDDNQKLPQDSIFWTSVEKDTGDATALIFNATNITIRDDIHKRSSHFIRCVKDDKTIQVEHGEMTDERDGQVYKTVKIGTQTWMAKNLNYAYPKQDSSSDSVSWCYNNEPDSCAKYGRLYTWEAAIDCYALGDYYMNCSRLTKNKTSSKSKIQGICPQNWHIPSENEWNTLLGLVNNFATDLKSTNGWLDDGNGTDIVGFGALPAGLNYNEFGEDLWGGVGQVTCFWTPGQSTVQLDDLGPINYYESGSTFCLSNHDRAIFYDNHPKEYAFSVRCVKDAEASE